MYPVIADPPSLDGADQDSATCVLPRVAAGLCGALGAPGGVGVAVAELLAVPVPIALTAETLK